MVFLLLRVTACNHAYPGERGAGTRSETDEMELKNALIEFLDINKRPLHAIQAEDASRYMKVNTLGNRPSPRVRYIAISLEGIPLRLLDEVVSIRIAK
jgi:hypothetical protein